MEYRDPLKKIERCLKEDKLLWIFRDSFDPDLAGQVASRCGLRSSAGGSGTRNLGEMASEFKKNPKARQLISFYLNETNKQQIHAVKKIDSNELTDVMASQKDEMFADGTIGKFLWALIEDPRIESGEAIKELTDDVESDIEQFDELFSGLEDLSKLEKKTGIDADWAKDFRRELEKLKRLPKGRKQPFPKFPKPPVIPKPPPSREKLQRELEKVKGELKYARESVDKLRSKSEMLSDKSRQYQEENKRILTEMQVLKHEKNIMERETAELVVESESQRKKLEQVEELGHNVHHLERENRKLEYRVEKLGNLDSTLEDMVADNERLLGQVDQLKKNLNRMEQTLIENEAELERSYERLDKLKEKPDKKIMKKETLNKKKPKVGIFVDVQNVFYGAKEKYGAKLDYQKLFNEALRERTLFKAICYVVKSDEIKKNDFIKFLKQIGYEVKTKDLKTRMDGSQKGDWDLGIAIDIIMQAEKMDVIVLVSGDGDFIDLLRLVQQRFKKRVEVFSFPHNTAIEIEETADAYFPIDERFLMN